MIAQVLMVIIWNPIVLFIVTDDRPRSGSTIFFSDDNSPQYSLEKRSLSVVPEHFTAGKYTSDHMINYDIMLLDDKKVVMNHIMSCKNILKLVSAHNGQTALHEAVKVSANIIVLLSSMATGRLAMFRQLNCYFTMIPPVLIFKIIMETHPFTWHVNSSPRLIIKLFRNYWWVCPHYDVIFSDITQQEFTDLSLRNNDHKMAEDLCLSVKLRNEVNFHFDLYHFTHCHYHR